MWTRPTKVGERAWLICRAGICGEDFEDRIGELRAACFARDARITRNLRWSQVVTIDIIRRDTLAATHEINSPLMGLRLRAPARRQPRSRRRQPCGAIRPTTATARTAQRAPDDPPRHLTPGFRWKRDHRQDGLDTQTAHATSRERRLQRLRPPRSRAYARRVSTGDIDTLTLMTALSADIDTAIAQALTGLRGFGYSWADIANRLGVTRQAAQQRWGTHPTAAA